MKRPEEQTNDEWRDALDGYPTTSPNVPKRTAEPPIQDDSSDAVLDGDPLIPEGNYTVTYQCHATAIMGGKGKLVIHFVITHGPYQGTELRAFYPVELRGPPCSSGKFAAARNGNYYEQICEVFPDLVKLRTDRISPSRLAHKLIRAEVTTVKTKWNGDNRKPHTHYSKVNALLGIES